MPERSTKEIINSSLNLKYEETAIINPPPVITERNPNAESVSANPLLSDVADLKPCPFCGGEAGYSPSEDGNGKRFIYVECCICSGMSNSFVKKEDAKKAWNSRE